MRRPLERVPALLLAATTLAPAAAAQVVAPGDLLFGSKEVPGVGHAILRIDPQSGATSVLESPSPGQLYGDQALCYDPWRQCVLFCAFYETFPQPVIRLWELDSAGVVTPIGPTGVGVDYLAPGSGGRVYVKRAGFANLYQVLDAQDVLHDLMDASGTATYVSPSGNISAMEYDPVANALFVATGNGSWLCAPNTVSLHRLQLSLDGMRVLDDTDCVTFALPPTGGGLAVGLARRPDGMLAMVVHDWAAGPPDIHLIDPVTLDVAVHANTHGMLGSGGTWSSALDKPVVYDSFSDSLRTFAPGEGGLGTPIPTSMPISDAGFAGGVAPLCEVPVNPCADSVALYCTAKTTSQGCLPALSTSGCPSASAGGGFVLRADGVPVGNIGLFLYSHLGPAALPFQGGFLCVQPPAFRIGIQVASGAGVCGGGYAVDFNVHAASGSEPGLMPGAVVHGQFWFRDPPEPVSGTGLSRGVTFTLAP